MNTTTVKKNNARAKNESGAFASRLDNKLIIADTSSLLMAGTQLLDDLPECKLIIPSVVVAELEEKRTHFTLGFLAREWLRLIERLRISEGVALRKGVKIDTHENITLRIEPNHTSQKSLPAHLRDGSNDKTILAVAKNFALEEEKEHGRKDNVVVLSNDVPMRIFATLDLEIAATSYNYGVINKISPWKGVTKVEISENDVQDLYSSKAGKASAKDLSRSVVDLIKTEASENYSLVEIVLEGSNDLVMHVLKTPHGVVDIDNDVTAAGVRGRTIQQNVALQYLTEPADRLPIVSLGGSAGTGKTLLALAAGIDAVERGEYKKVIAFRSLHEMGQGQELGFLPGDADDKMRPWGGAIYDALGALPQEGAKSKDGKKPIYTSESNETKYKEIVEISPITYLRGRSLSDAYIIIEEAQNFSRSELLNILSRVGENSKAVFTFDSAQVDNKFLQSGDKADVWSVIDRLKTSDLFAHVSLVKTERSKVAQLASQALES